MAVPLTLSDIENTLHHLNYRWNLQALALWKGDRVPFEAYRIYEEYEDFLRLETLSIVDRIQDGTAKVRLRHGLMDHYLQRALLPHETEMRTWMRGAAAHVNGRKIYFRDIIPWCQKASTYEERQILQKETAPLCKFLKPFPLNYWALMLKMLHEDLGFEDYQDYCRQKKGIAYERYRDDLERFLIQTDDLYFPAMEQWARRRFDRPLDALTRFDAINLLGMAEFDHLFPRRPMEELARFFHHWGMDLESTPGLYLELGREEGKSSQAMCFILQVPEEVYVLMKPEGGWVDLETLWHELGHALSSVHTSPELSIVERDMATSYDLSESFAFLLQNLTLTRGFLEGFLNIGAGDAKNLRYHKVLKDMSVFRRYAAKFLVEYDMFQWGDLSDGESYARIMARYTGFYYQPESHLFDLVPEFYSLDYVMAWMAEAMMEEHIRGRLGDDWIFLPETGDLLREWWLQGNREDLDGFLKGNGLGALSPESLLNRWQQILN